MFLERHAFRLVVRERRRSLAIGVGVVLAAALTTTVLLFGSAIGSTVTRRALAGVKVDAQAVLTSGADPGTATQAVAQDSAVVAALPFDLVHFDAAELRKAGAATQTSTGALIGIDSTYPQLTGLFSVAQGQQAPGQVTISRDLATNLGAVPTDTVTFSLPGGNTVDLMVSGIVDITGADLILGPTDAAHRAAGSNPPSNAAVMDRASLDQTVLPLVPPGATAFDQSAVQTQAGGSPVTNPIPGVERQVHIQYDLAQLPGDPVAAQQWLDTTRRRIERDAVGGLTVIDDAMASLEPVAGDLLWGQVLFLFLALPGVALALAVSRLAADATSDSTRRHIALLRARGGSRGQLARVLLEATVAISIAGAFTGGLIGAAIAFLRFGNELSSVDPLGSTIRAVLISVVVVTLLGAIAAWMVLRHQLTEEVAAGRQELQRRRQPLWQRLYLDVIALIAAAVVFTATGGTGLKPVFTTEGNPTVTLALTSFVAPFLLWTGTTLLLLRVFLWWIGRGAGIRPGLERTIGGAGVIAAGTLRSRATAVTRAIVILSLAVSLATSVLIFDATYRQQQAVDAALTLGADLKITPSGQTDPSAVSLVTGPDIPSATPFVDRIVYVGAEAQDLLAIDPSTLPQVSPMSDTFFDGLTASQAMDALAGQPDAILVSSETARDYSIVPGDQLKIRVPDSNGNLVPVVFHMAGVALEFPTAPQDAFLVANQSYVAAQTGNNRISYVLAKVSGDPAGAAASASQRLGSGWQVESLSTETARLANGITSVDLAALVEIEVAFLVLIAAVGTALFLLAEIAERRRELATLEAIGAEPGQLRAALAAETVLIGIAGVLSGLIVGALLGFAFLQILAGVFDPPAQLPAVPVVQLVVVLALVAVALAVALSIASRQLSRLEVVSALRER
jgi:putative ABC transport system permease protein